MVRFCSTMAVYIFLRCDERKLRPKAAVPCQVVWLCRLNWNVSIRNCWQLRDTFASRWENLTRRAAAGRSVP